MEFVKYQIPSILFGLMASIAIIKEAQYAPFIGFITCLSIIVSAISYCSTKK